MATLAFLARVVAHPGEAKYKAHRNIKDPLAAYLVTNDATGHVIWASPEQVRNVVDNVALVVIEAELSGSIYDDWQYGSHRVWINPFTHDRIKRPITDIIKENA